MGKRIAVVTGASSGIGRTFALSLKNHGSYDEVWVIARSADKLEALRDEIPFKLRPVPLDLSDERSFDAYGGLLESEKPDIALLINCSGFGKFSAVTDTEVGINTNMVDLNCRAVLAMTQISLPYMKSGAEIIEIASLAAFQPTPYICVYAATKAFVLSFSRALNRELKGRGIKVLAVCPFWTKTGFFARAVDDKNVVVTKYIAMYEPQQIVDRAFSDLKKGKDVSKFGFAARAQAAMVKLMPHSLVMNVWLRQQKLK